jgi:hypothetical protein
VIRGTQLITMPLLAFSALPQETKDNSKIEGYQSEFTEIINLIALRQEKNNGKPDPEQGGNQNDRSDRFTFWDLAELGVTGYNAFARKDVRYQRTTNEEGRTASLALGNFEYARKR